MAALGPLRRVLQSGTLSGALILAATPLGALAAGPPDPAVTGVPGPPGNAPVEEIIAQAGNIGPVRDTEIEGDVVLGPTPAEVKTIIQQTLSAMDLQTLVRDAARGAALETDTRVRELGAELDLQTEVLARMFEILLRLDVPPERLADALGEIAARHKSLLERVRLLEASEPRAAELRDAAAAAIETTEYDHADALLAEAEAIQIEAVQQLQEALDQRVRKAAAIYVPWGDVAGTQLEYGKAAEHGALLHGGGRAGFEGLRRFVPSDRFCQRHPEHRLCERWADSSPLCDRLPNHPLCNDDDDDGFCRRHPDHKRCEQPPSPS